MDKRKQILLIILVFLSIGGFIYSSMNVFTAMKTIDQVIRLVRDFYVNPVEIDKILDFAIEAIANSLDVHTTYLKESDFENLMIQTKGEFGGLGIRISKRGDYITIIAPIEDTPAYRAGLLQGDKITAIEGISTKDMNLNKAVSMMRGEPGTSVTITTSRTGVDKEIDFTITRDIIKIKTVPYAGVVDEGVGYVRLNSFSKTSSTEIKNAIDSLIFLGINKFILDLRDNPGGILSEAVEVASLFINKGKEVVYTEGKSVHESYNSKDGSYAKYPLVVLVNSYSASGSEIVAGAIQDWDNGLLLGTKTFGKGSVQRAYPLHNNKALKLTIARYHTPSGRCIDRELASDTTAIYHTRGELHREVKGGGGIIPDSIITYKPTELFAKIFSHNIAFDFIVSYNSKYPEEDYVTTEMLREFKEKVIENEIAFTEEEWENSLDEIKKDLQWRLAYKIFGTKRRYQVIIPNDEIIQSAISILKRVEVPSDLYSYLQ